jgi:hypothetical protein
MLELLLVLVTGIIGSRSSYFCVGRFFPIAAYSTFNSTTSGTSLNKQRETAHSLLAGTGFSSIIALTIRHSAQIGRHGQQQARLVGPGSLAGQFLGRN